MFWLWKGCTMRKSTFVVAAIAAMVAAPVSAATVTYGSTTPGGVVTLTPAGPGAIASPISFDVTGTGPFAAVFTFFNPYPTARGNGSASFNFDPDVLMFTSGSFSDDGSTFTLGGVPGVGSSIQVDVTPLDGGLQRLILMGELNSSGTPEGGNDFARVGGSITLTSVAGAIPEPATWALFILGFGAVGGALRRRASAVRVTKAKLNFA